MKKMVVSAVAGLSTVAQAHSLDSLPEGLLHELLHLMPVLVPLVLVAVIGKHYLSNK